MSRSGPKRDREHAWLGSSTGSPGEDECDERGEQRALGHDLQDTPHQASYRCSSSRRIAARSGARSTSPAELDAEGRRRLHRLGRQLVLALVDVHPDAEDDASARRLREDAGHLAAADHDVVRVEHRRVDGQRGGDRLAGEDGELGPHGDRPGGPEQDREEQRLSRSVFPDASQPPASFRLVVGRHRRPLGIPVREQALRRLALRHDAGTACRVVRAGAGARSRARDPTRPTRLVGL